MITDRDIRDHVLRSLTCHEDEFNIDAIVDEIQRTYGLIDAATIDHDAYWAIVERHAVKSS